MPRLLSVLCAVAMVFALLPVAPTPALGATGVYNSDDVAVVNNIITTNGLAWTLWNDGVDTPPSDWNASAVTWSDNPTNKRIIRLTLDNMNLNGVLDVGNLTALQTLNCENNQLIGLFALPAGLQTLICSNNQLKALPTLPANLWTLVCGGNQLMNLPALPASLRELYCADNQLMSLPALPTSLTSLICDGNQLMSLPALPAGLLFLYCSYNQLTSLPALPADLYILFCSDNDLTALDLTGLTGIFGFYGPNQTPTRNLTGTGPSYTAPITLNTPTFGNVAISYSAGTLTSTDNTVASTTFSVATGNPSYTLTGTLNLTYPSVAPTYAVTVEGGTGDGSYEQGTPVTITADTPLSGKRFKGWTTTSPDVVFADAKAATTTFVMPASTVTVTAVFEDTTRVYNSDDIAVINNIIATNGLAWTPWSADETTPPFDWDASAVTWSDNPTDKRITELYLEDENLLGMLDVGNLTALQVFSCDTNQLTSLLALPASLEYLDCDYNYLTGLPALPANLLSLDCNDNQLESLPELPTNLQYLECYNNQLTALPALPANLEDLDCGNNQLTDLPALPANLEELGCSDNQLTALPALPANLLELECYDNQLTALPALPANLEELGCAYNQLTALPALPASLDWLDCAYNQLTALPALPASLDWVDCAYNQLTALPALPANLEELDCSYNQLKDLPALPASLKWLSCTYNQLEALPTLPAGLLDLYCWDNQLTSLPALPVSLWGLSCYNNQLTALPALPTGLGILNCDGNQLTALDLTGLTSIYEFNGSNQTPTLNLTSTGPSYTAPITLNTPTFGDAAISYSPGTLTSTDDTVTSTTFSVATGNPSYTLSGTLNFTYGPYPVTSVTLDPTSITLYTKTGPNTAVLIPVIVPINATDKTVTWTSSNPSVARVDALGRVTAAKTGTAKITVTTNDGKKKATCTVTVASYPINVTGVTLKVKSKTMTLGTSFALVATISPSKATDKAMTWTSSDPTVATVDTAGKVTAIKTGTTTITVTTRNGGKVATCVITVVIPVKSVTLNLASKTLETGLTFVLTPTVMPTDATDKTVTWKSSNPSVARVDALGTVTAAKPGTTKITVTTKDGSKKATCTVTVTAQLIANGTYTIRTVDALAKTKAIGIQDASLSDGAVAQIKGADNTAAQRFTITRGADGYYTITNINSNKVLGVAGATVASGDTIGQYTSDGTDAQKWTVSKNRDKSYTFSPKLNDSLCLSIQGGLAANGAALQLLAKTGTAAQSFKLIAPTPSVRNGIYTIGASYTSKVVDVSGGSMDDGANIQLWAPNKTLAQRFWLAYDAATGYYTAINLGSGRALSVGAPGPVGGPNVEQRALDGSFAQKWAVEKVGCRYRITSALSGLVLDATGAGTSNGTNVQTWEPNGGAAQAWKLSRVG